MNPELWQTRPWFALATLAPVLAGLAWMALARELPWSLRHRHGLGWATWVGTRAVFAAVVWGLLGHSGIDQTAFFLPQARQALAGALPYRDFGSAYGPLFAPLLGQCVRFLGDVGPFVLFLAADLVAWRALARSEGEASEAAWAYLATPITWYFTVRYAQDESLSAAFLALAWWALRRERGWAAGLCLGLGLCLTKPLFALPALAIWLGADRRRGALLAGAVPPVLLVYGLFLAWGAPVLQPFTLEGSNFGIGPTLWRVPVVLTGWDAGGWGWLAFGVLAAVGVVLLLRRGGDGADHTAWQYGAFAAFAPKFMPMYAAMWAPLLAVWAGRDPDRRGWWLVYGVILPLAWALDSGPLQGLFGAVWQVIAVLGLTGIALLALWPVRTLARG